MSCCPEGSWAELKEDYITIGTEIQLDGIKIYTVGSGEKCIIYNHDIFGWMPSTCGRTRAICDFLAKNGYFVILPDYFEGDHRNPFDAKDLPEFIKKTSHWSKLKEEIDTVVAFAKAKGAISFAGVGTCWGSYPVVKMSATKLLSCGVSMHPSHGILGNILGEEEIDMLRDIKVPQLFMPCGNDPESLKKGGLSSQILKDNLKIIEFSNMQHGFTGRGELEKVKKELEQEMNEILNFLKIHM